MLIYSVTVLGILVFQLKRRPPDYIPKKSQKHMDGKPLHGKERVDGSGYGAALPPEKLPYLVELSPGERCYQCTFSALHVVLFNECILIGLSFD